MKTVLKFLGVLLLGPALALFVFAVLGQALWDMGLRGNMVGTIGLSALVVMALLYFTSLVNVARGKW